MQGRWMHGRLLAHAQMGRFWQCAAHHAQTLSPKRPQTCSPTSNDAFWTITCRDDSTTRPLALFCGPRTVHGSPPRSPHKSACGSPQCGPTHTLPHTPHMPYRFLGGLSAHDAGRSCIPSSQFFLEVGSHLIACARDRDGREHAPHRLHIHPDLSLVPGIHVLLGALQVGEDRPIPRAHARAVARLYDHLLKIFSAHLAALSRLVRCCAVPPRIQRTCTSGLQGWAFKMEYWHSYYPGLVASAHPP